MARRPPALRRWLLRTAATGLVAAVVLLPRSAPGTVAEQRARLPPPADCEHPVEGIWRSHQYSPRFHDWVEFTLEVRRADDAGTELVGSITNHTWAGGPKREQPGPCTGEQRWRLRVAMKARGSFEDGDIMFEGTEWRLDQVICGRLPSGFGYNLDRFTGRIDPKLQEFQSVNNDGGRSVNEPTVFRRIACLGDNVPPPGVGVRPPPILPPKKTGCSCD